MNRYLEKVAQMCKQAETEGKANYEVDSSVTPDRHSQEYAASLYKLSEKHLGGGSMFISRGKDNYQYHPKTGLRKLKSLSFGD